MPSKIKGKRPPTDEEIAAIVRRLQSPEALVRAEAPVKRALAAAGRRHEEILRRSKELARWIFVR